MPQAFNIAGLQNCRTAFPTFTFCDPANLQSCNVWYCYRASCIDMRYLVLTDIHANLEALEACLADARARGYDRTLVLGDLVGYGADPNAVIERVARLNPHAIVRGNHDKVACGIEAADGFNTVARSAAHWTLDILTDEHRQWLAALPRGPIQVDDLVEICHGSPFDEDAYIFDELDAARALKTSTRPLCLFGHTHYPAVFELANDGLDSVSTDAEESALPLVDGSKYLVNPGSVGQPRDGDPRAAYGIVDESARWVELFRVKYAVNEARTKIVKAGLPEVLAQRLTVGR
jgi:diadenosine tetraphosphatase ApaH/serine/threonine PP2A family protein phosphatase